MLRPVSSIEAPDVHAAPYIIQELIELRVRLCMGPHNGRQDSGSAIGKIRVNVPEDVLNDMIQNPHHAVHQGSVL